MKKELKTAIKSFEVLKPAYQLLIYPLDDKSKINDAHYTKLKDWNPDVWKKIICNLEKHVYQTDRDMIIRIVTDSGCNSYFWITKEEYNSIVR